MKRLPLLLLMLSAGIFLTFRTLGTTGKSGPPSKYERILQSVGEMLKQGHYSPKDINDNFSKIVFRKFLEDLDPDRNILLQLVSFQNSHQYIPAYGNDNLWCPGLICP